MSSIRDKDQSLTAQAQTSDSFRPDIEGLRAVAVVAVVLFHSNMPGVGGGFVGVDTFFVISGFLITGLLWREVQSTGAIRVGRFYGARARRLLPASAVVGIVTLIASAVLLSPLETKTIIGDGIACALYVGNYRFARQGVDYFQNAGMTSPFRHYWSLGVEEQFYLVWPALIIGTAWLLHRASRRTASENRSTAPYLITLALVGSGSFALSLSATRAAPPLAFFSLQTRAWELATGGVIALTVPLWRRLPPFVAVIAGWVGLGLILLACSRLSATTPYPGTAALLPVVGAALVIGVGCTPTVWGCGRVLSLPPMRTIGRLSYSWYLWHWPVLVLAAPLLGHPLGLIDGVVAILVSIALAVLTLRLVENPFRYAISMRKSAARSLALGGAATALAVCVGLLLQVLVPTPIGRGPAAPTLAVTAVPIPPGRSIELYDQAVRDAFTQVQAAVTASADVKAIPSNLDPPLADSVYRNPPAALKRCVLNLLKVNQPECAVGDPAAPTKVALVGDSNAGMWMPAFENAALQRHWRLETMSKASCPMLDLPITIFNRNYTECDRWRSETLSRLGREHPQLIIVGMLRHKLVATAAGAPAYTTDWFASLTRLVKQLRGTGAKVLVLGPTPDLHSMVPDCLATHLNDAVACSSPRSTALSAKGISAEEATSKAAGGTYGDVTKLFCTATLCPPIIGNTLVYHNEFHVTAEYARLLAPAMGVLADRSLHS